jgi:hypothetical protein
MTQSRIDPLTEIPEADRLEQDTPATPDALNDEPGTPAAPTRSLSDAAEVDEADLLEQLTVPGRDLPDDDEYPRDA